MFVMDEVIGHTREKLIVPPREDIEARIVDRIRQPDVQPEDYASFGHIATPEAIMVPFPAVGDGYGICLSPYTHNEMGYPSTSVRDQDRMARRLIQKIRANVDKLAKFESAYLDDAKSVVVSYGCSARSALTAVKNLRAEGMKIHPLVEKYFRVDRMPHLACPGCGIGMVMQYTLGLLMSSV